jgi:hypothetical protein
MLQPSNFEHQIIFVMKLNIHDKVLLYLVQKNKLHTKSIKINNSKYVKNISENRIYPTPMSKKGLSPTLCHLCTLFSFLDHLTTPIHPFTTKA